jgi:hypothetical protein
VLVLHLGGQGQSGDFVVGNSERLLTAADDIFSQGNFANAVTFHVTSAAHASLWWRSNFAVTGGAPLVPGVYSNATRWPFQGATSQRRRAVLQHPLRRFVVLKVSFAAVGVVDRFAADFEHCEGPAAGTFRIQCGTTPRQFIHSERFFA